MSVRVADPSIELIARAAAECQDLATLGSIVRGCEACPELAISRTTVVVGDLPPTPQLLVVGEAPGANEDLAGRPFIGKGGQLLDELMSQAGLDRGRVAVLNVLKCRPPANRTPTTAEARRCSGWLDRQVELLDPPFVLTLGRTALTWALGAKVTLDAARGVEHNWRRRRLVVSYHPSAAIRFGPSGAPRKALEADLHFLAELLR
ncbi:MAG: uracil-DNA glycosylase [Frankiaceae bacterium]|nr:uracil-DNA glycosylase [Frankiaceae bacterium]MBV9871665.1 uracil-DNA glycosylase [Frankiaceae bacterium]